MAAHSDATRKTSSSRSATTVARTPLRIRQRPTPDEWKDDELMTLEEAAALFWPDGPLTTTSLRTAVRDNVLDVALIAGKLLTSKSAIGRMSLCRPRKLAPPEPAPKTADTRHKPTDRELLRAFRPD